MAGAEWHREGVRVPGGLGLGPQLELGRWWQLPQRERGFFWILDGTPSCPSLEGVWPFRGRLLRDGFCQPPVSKHARGTWRVPCASSPPPLWRSVTLAALSQCSPGRSQRPSVGEGPRLWMSLSEPGPDLGLQPSEEKRLPGRQLGPAGLSPFLQTYQGRLRVSCPELHHEHCLK